jgi:hypothetical protein
MAGMAREEVKSMKIKTRVRGGSTSIIGGGGGTRCG